MKAVIVIFSDNSELVLVHPYQNEEFDRQKANEEAAARNSAVKSFRYVEAISLWSKS